MIVAERLRSLRTNTGETFKSLSKKTGIAPSHLCEYENGKRVPPLSALKKLHDFYSVSYEYLLGEYDDEYSFDANIESTQQSELLKDLVNATFQTDDPYHHSDTEILRQLYSTTFGTALRSAIIGYLNSSVSEDDLSVVLKELKALKDANLEPWEMVKTAANMANVDYTN